MHKIPFRAVAVCLSCFIALAAFASIASADLPEQQVQIYDVAQKQVVKKLDNTEAIQKEALGWLTSIQGVAPQMQLDPKCGFVYRVPFKSPVPVTFSSISGTVTEVFLFHCESRKPMLLIFVDRKPHLLQFQRDVAPFLKLVGSFR